MVRRGLPSRWSTLLSKREVLDYLATPPLPTPAAENVAVADCVPGIPGVPSDSLAGFGAIGRNEVRPTRPGVGKKELLPLLPACSRAAVRRPMYGTRVRNELPSLHWRPVRVLRSLGGGGVCTARCGGEIRYTRSATLW